MRYTFEYGEYFGKNLRHFLPHEFQNKVNDNSGIGSKCLDVYVWKSSTIVLEFENDINAQERKILHLLLKEHDPKDHISVSQSLNIIPRSLRTTGEGYLKKARFRFPGSTYAKGCLTGNMQSGVESYDVKIVDVSDPDNHKIVVESNHVNTRLQTEDMEAFENITLEPAEWEVYVRKNSLYKTKKVQVESLTIFFT